MVTSAALAARVKATLLNGGPTRRLFQLRQRHPELAYELDQIAIALKDAGDELIRWADAQSHDDAA
jgi:hypothetical protein